MAIDSESVVVRDPQLLFSEMDREVVVLNMAGNNYVGLDVVGSRIWALLQTPQRVEDLCVLLSREYAATAEEIAAGVLPFLSELVSEGLVQVVGDAPA